VSSTPLLVQQQNVFRDLQFEQARCEAGGVEHLRNRGCKVAGLKLRRGKIDADANVVPGLLPDSRLPASGFENPGRDPLRNGGSVDDRHEFRRRQRPQTGWRQRIKKEGLSTTS
jgi:hypothetical protein